MQSTPTIGPLIMGASGRLGRALARVWPAEAPPPVWQTRDGAGGTLAWDILAAPPPPMPAVGGVIVLAGVTRGDAAALAANTPLAQAGADLGRRLGVPVLVASSQAVYGAPDGPAREGDPCAPVTAYGAAKLAMERAVAAPHVTALRIGNVAGCDAIFAAMARGGVTLDRFADGRGPRRAMLGPADLARALTALLAAPRRPPVVNLARPGLIAMEDLLRAAGLPVDWRPAPAGALAELALDVTLLQGICPLPVVDAAAMLAQGGLR